MGAPSGAPVAPPSTTISAPVTFDASSDALGNFRAPVGLGPAPSPRGGLPPAPPTGDEHGGRRLQGRHGETVTKRFDRHQHVVTAIENGAERLEPFDDGSCTCLVRIMSLDLS